MLLENKKILIIDFDIFNKSLDLIFGYDAQKQKEKTIIKISNNIDLLSKIEIFFAENNYLEKNKIKNILNNFSKKYDLIIIDNTSEYSCEHTKEILKNSDSIIFLSDANLIELNKTKKLLEKYDTQKEKFEMIKTNLDNLKNEELAYCDIKNIINDAREEERKKKVCLCSKYIEENLNKILLFAK